MADRFYRPKDKEEIFKRLTTGDDAPFLTFKDLFVMAACIGCSNDQRVPSPPKGEQIHWNVFKPNTDQVMINAIALAENGDFGSLLDTEAATNNKFSLIEEYVSAGIDELKKVLLDTPGDPLDNLVNLIFTLEQSSGGERSRDLLNAMELDL